LLALEWQGEGPKSLLLAIRALLHVQVDFNEFDTSFLHGFIGFVTCTDWLNNLGKAAPDGLLLDRRLFAHDVHLHAFLHKSAAPALRERLHEGLVWHIDHLEGRQERVACVFYLLQGLELLAIGSHSALTPRLRFSNRRETSCLGSSFCFYRQARFKRFLLSNYSFRTLEVDDAI